MKRLIFILFIEGIALSFCVGQFSISGGLNFSQYLGHGEGDNYYKIKKPGFQVELAKAGDGSFFRWVLWGISYYSAQNIVGNNTIPVQVWTPYYTELQFLQKEKKNPLFWSLGFDYIRMRYPNIEAPDIHYNITFGGGWQIKLNQKVNFHLKIKPYFIIGNSLGQWFGINTLFNINYRFE